MAWSDWYQVWSTKDANVYKVSKYDADLNFLEFYHISELPGDTLICQCPAGSKPTCRHRKMLRLFQGLKEVDSGKFYNFDKDKWQEAMKS